MIAVRQTRLCLRSQLLKGPTPAAVGSLVFESTRRGFSASLEGNTVINDAKKMKICFPGKLNI